MDCDGFSESQAYSDILQAIDPRGLHDIKQVKVFVQAALKDKSHRHRAVEFAARYCDLTNRG